MFDNDKKFRIYKISIILTVVVWLVCILIVFYWVPNGMTNNNSVFVGNAGALLFICPITIFVVRRQWNKERIDCEDFDISKNERNK